MQFQQEKIENLVNEKESLECKFDEEKEAMFRMEFEIKELKNDRMTFKNKIK